MSYKTISVISKYMTIFILSCLLLSCQSNSDQKNKNLAKSDPVAQLIKNATILDIQALMESKQLTAESLTNYYLQQIKEQNPILHAVISINPNAIEDAKKLDQERQSGKVRGPMHGIPMLIKDNIETLELPDNRRCIGAQRQSNQ